MAEERIQRRLAAILAADVVGYSRLMETDEAGTMAALKARRRQVLEPLVTKHHGRVFKATGDGVLVEFASAVNAVQCAVDLQSGMAKADGDQPEDRRIVLRIGVNLGDIMAEGGDLYGDGVNVAARLESIAEPGGICLSAMVHQNVKTKLALAFEDMGEQRFKNIAEPIRAFRIRLAPIAVPALRTVGALALPDKPSIAVLPFQNMSGDPEQEYFADGMVEDIITALSRFNALFVIARNSSFTYKGHAVDVKQVGRDLGVRYVLEGSVRKSGNRVRITGQLVDTSSGAHLWADRFDGGLEDVFDLQDRVTTSVVGAIAPRLEQAEINRSRHKPTESLDAYDHYLRGMAGVHQWTKEANGEALSHFYKAIELDPNFASAYGMAARCYDQRMANGWVTERAHEIAETARLARQAAKLGKDDAVALCMAGYSLAFVVVGGFDDGAALIDRALLLNPNLAVAWLSKGWIKVYRSDPEVAIECTARAMRLSPHDPYMFDMQTVTSLAHFFAGRFAEALPWAEAAAREQPNFGPALRMLAASSAMTGRHEQAQTAIASLLELQPSLRISNLQDLFLGARPEGFTKRVEALRMAGLPE